MTKVKLAKDERLIDYLNRILVEGENVLTQVCFSQAMEEDLFGEMTYGSCNVPYMGVEMRAFRSNAEIVELYYKKEKCRVGASPDETEELDVVLYLKLGDKFYLFGAGAPEECIIIAG